MRKEKKGTTINVEYREILKMWYRLVLNEIISEDEIYKLYKVINDIPKQFQARELESIINEFIIQCLVNNEEISQEVADLILSYISKSIYNYQFLDNGGIHIRKKENNENTNLNEASLDEETVKELYKLAITSNFDENSVYYVYRDIMEIEKNNRAIEIKKLRENLKIKELYMRGFISEEEMNTVLKKVGESKLANKILCELC